MSDALERFGPATQDWFRDAFAQPTTAQAGAWDAISAGKHALVVAPTGSGKTLSAFLWAIDRIFREPYRPPRTRKRGDAVPPRTRVLYVSPLKALGVDVERNLRSPLVGIGQAARRRGVPVPDVTVGVRSGDTTSADRRKLVTDPPDVLITTPESLYLMLTSQAAETLRGVHTVIVDEVHAVAATKRGAHLAVSLERLDALLERPAQRIGLSATVRPIDEVARFLGGAAPVEIVAPRATKAFDLRVVVPMDDMLNPPPPPGTDAGGGGAADPDGGPADPDGGPADGDGDWFAPPPSTEMTGSVWPHVEEAIVDRILAHRSTIVFANSRRLAERLTGRLNEIHAERLGLDVPDPTVPAAMGAHGAEAPRGANATRGGANGEAQAGISSGVAPILAKAHHGSVSKEQRAQVEDELKSGILRCVVATSSLELGIDMGAVDLVIQVEAPPSAASGLQRVGRAGHQVGEVSRAALFPKHRGDVLHTAVVTERMLAGQIEAIAVPQNPLDILAQQTVAACAVGPVDVEGWFETVKRSAPFRTLPRSAYEATLDLLAGRFPSDEFAELRPRIVWDRDHGTLTGRPGAQRIAVTSGGTIPDRGLFGVFVAGEARNARVGELDEEMVYESRVGDVFTLGTTSWRIVEITHDRVNVLPAFGQPGKLPFWHGDGLGRPAELGEALGRFSREIATASVEKATARLRESGLDDNAIGNLLAYLAEQREATGSLPTDRTLTVERSRDEVGDWRIILHSPYGMHVHAPWALAVNARIREQLGVEGAAVASDDGIIARVPDAAAEPPGADLFVFDPDELEQLVTAEVGGSALFASRFRESAARALLLPRLNPSRRSPLWQQRQRSAQLLEVARRHPTFPIILETLREVLQDVYDLPALLRIARSIGDRRIRLVETTTAQPSPFARDLLFGYVGAFMYEGDSPLAERRAAALSVDPALLSELLGKVELRELLDPGVIAQFEREARLDPERCVRGVEGAADLLRSLARSTPPRSPNGSRSARLTVPSGTPPDRSARPRCWSRPRPRRRPERRTRRRRAATTTRRPHGPPRRSRRHPLISRRFVDARSRDPGLGSAVRPASPRSRSAAFRDALGTALPVAGPDGVPRSGRRSARRLRQALRAHARPVPHRGARGAHRRAGRRTPDAAAPRVAGRMTSGTFLPVDGTRPDDRGDLEWCDSEVLRRLRLRSLSPRSGQRRAGRARGVRPLPARVAARRPATRRRRRHARRDRAARRHPASRQRVGVALSCPRGSPTTPRRCSTSSPRPVRSCGRGTVAARPRRMDRAASRRLPRRLAGQPEDEPTPFERRILDALDAGGAYFAAQLVRMTDAENEQSVVDALWNLTWSGRVTNDSRPRRRAHSPSGPQAHLTARRTPRTRLLSRHAARASWRWKGCIRAPAGARRALAAPPAPEADAALRATRCRELLLDRYGVVTRGSVQAEGLPGLRRRTACSPGSRRRATADADTSSRSSARRSSRHPPPSTGCAHSSRLVRSRALLGADTRGDRPGEPVRGGAAVARDRGPPSGSQGGRHRGARRRRPRALPGARRQVRARLHRRRGGARGGRARPRRHLADATARDQDRSSRWAACSSTARRSGARCATPASWSRRRG